LEGVVNLLLPAESRSAGAEERIRTKLLKDGHIATVIGLPAHLFYSTGIPVCILVLKERKKPLKELGLPLLPMHQSK
jgi:type I restriction enzyme M protein